MASRRRPKRGGRWRTAGSSTQAANKHQSVRQSRRDHLGSKHRRRGRRRKRASPKMCASASVVVSKDRFGCPAHLLQLLRARGCSANGSLGPVFWRQCTLIRSTPKRRHPIPSPRASNPPTLSTSCSRTGCEPSDRRRTSSLSPDAAVAWAASTFSNSRWPCHLFFNRPTTCPHLRLDDKVPPAHGPSGQR